MSEKGQATESSTDRYDPKKSPGPGWVWSDDFEQWYFPPGSGNPMNDPEKPPGMEYAWIAETKKWHLRTECDMDDNGVWSLKKKK